MRGSWKWTLARGTAIVGCCVLGCLGGAREARAQNHWGVTVSLVPVWEPVPELYELLYGVNSVSGDGREFRIGLTRGSDLGGEWSVSFVRSSIRAGTTFDELTPLIGSDGVEGPPVGTFGVAGRDLRIDGLKFDWFKPFVTVKDRLQVGVAFGVGVGQLKGSVEEHDVQALLDFPPPDFQPVILDVVEEVTVFDAAEESELSTIPLGNVELAVAVILAPGLKLRLSGGFNFPNTQVFAVTASYLIGAR